MKPNKQKVYDFNQNWNCLVDWRNTNTFGTDLAANKGMKSSLKEKNSIVKFDNQIDDLIELISDFFDAFLSTQWTNDLVECTLLLIQVGLDCAFKESISLRPVCVSIVVQDDNVSVLVSILDHFGILKITSKWNSTIRMILLTFMPIWRRQKWDQYLFECKVKFPVQMVVNQTKSEKREHLKQVECVQLEYTTKACYLLTYAY